MTGFSKFKTLIFWRIFKTLPNYICKPVIRGVCPHNNWWSFVPIFLKLYSRVPNCHTGTTINFDIFFPSVRCLFGTVRQLIFQNFPSGTFIYSLLAVLRGNFWQKLRRFHPDVLSCWHGEYYGVPNMTSAKESLSQIRNINVHVTRFGESRHAIEMQLVTWC